MKWKIYYNCGEILAVIESCYPGSQGDLVTIKNIDYQIAQINYQPDKKVCTVILTKHFTH